MRQPFTASKGLEEHRGGVVAGSSNEGAGSAELRLADAHGLLSGVDPGGEVALIVEPSGFAQLVLVYGMIANQVDLSFDKGANRFVMVPDGGIIDNRFREGGEIDAFAGLGGVVNRLELHLVEQEIEQRHLFLGAVFDQLLNAPVTE